MATYTDKFSSNGATLKLVITTDSYSITNNTSYLKCVLQITKDQNYSSYNLVDASISMTINGSKLYSSKTFDIRSLSVGSTKTLATKYITISHNSDGKKSITCKASFDSGVKLGSASISDTFTCVTIPRASSLSLSATSVNVGSTITANISRKSTSFVHDVEFFIAGWGLGSQDGINKGYYKKYTGITTSKAYTIPTAWYNYMSESTSCNAWCRITTRDSSGNQIGSKAEASFTAKVPTSIVPSVGTITFDPWNITIKDGTEKDILVQGKNKFTLSVSGCAAGTGSSIKSYTFSGPGLTTTTQTGTSINGGPVSSTGSLTYTVKVTDKRGRTASKTISGSSNRAYCYAYSQPYISSFSVYKARKNSDGSYTADNNGTYLKCDYNPVYSQISGNNALITMYYTTGSTTKSTTGASGSVVVSGINPDSTYKIYLTITDNYNGTGTTAIKTILGAFRTMNVYPNGNGIAFGKKSEPNKSGFECAWNSRFYKNIYLEGNILMDTNNSYIYGTTTDDEYALLTKLSGNNNVLVGSQEVANGTYIYGGKNKAVTIGDDAYKSDLVMTNASYIYGKTTAGSNGNMIGISSSNNTLVGNATYSNSTYIYGGTDKTVHIGSGTGDYRSDLVMTNNSCIYGQTTAGNDASMLRLSSVDYVMVGSPSVAKKTHVLGGADKTVTIGSTDYKSDLRVTGAASGPSGFSTSSDRRVKKNIENCDLDIVDKLQPITYQLIDSEDDKTHYGFVAQDVMQILLDMNIDPESCGIIGTVQNGDTQQYVLTYTEFVPLLVNKCQNLQSELNELKQDIAELKKLIT